MWWEYLTSFIFITTASDLAPSVCRRGWGHWNIQYSKFDGFSTIPEMVQTAKDFGMTACGLTDHGTFAGAIDFLQECRDVGIRPILGCMPAGSLIYTPGGVVPIEKIEVGDTVLTHNGNFRNVTKAFSRNYTGSIYRIKVAKCNSVISLTGEHPVFCKQFFDGEPVFREVSLIDCGYRTEKAGIHEWNCYCSFPVVKNNFNKSLNLLDYLSNCKYTNENGCIKKNKMSKFDRETLYNIPVCLDYSYELGVFIGFYLAEGSLLRQKGNPKSTVFSCHDDLDRHRCVIVSEYLKQFGYCLKDNVRLDKGSGVSNEVRVDSVVWSEFLSAYCGLYFDRKELSFNAFGGGDDFIQGILYGVCADVGSSNRRKMLKLGNRNLIYQIKMLLSSVGYFVNVTESWCKASHRFNYSIYWNKEAKHRLYFRENNKYWFPIKEIVQDNFSGKVYNFEVNEDNSYVSNISLHNCEAYLSKDHCVHDKKGQPTGRRGNRHINLIAKNYAGFQNICTLSQVASLDGFYYDPRVDLKLLDKYSDGVMATSACLSNVVNNALAYDRYDQAKKSVALFKDIYGEDYYLEAMYHGIALERRILPQIQKLGKEMNVKVLATNDCLLPGSLILTQQGYKRIESVSKKDLVITHKGRLRPIEYVSNRLYDGELYNIYSSLGSSCISCTPNHPVLVNKTNGSGWTVEGDLRWVKAQNVKVGDLLCVPKNKTEFAEWHKDYENTINVMSVVGDRWHAKVRDGVVKSCRTDKKAGVPTTLRIDRHFCQVVGLFLAEGYIDGTVIGFGLHKTEHVLRDIICSYFERFNFHPTVTEEGSGIRICVNSFVFAAILENTVGKGSSRKMLPSTDIFSEEEIKTIIRYYFEGDGSMNNNGKTYMVASCSEFLIWELSNLLKTWDILSLPTRRDGKDASLRHSGAKSEWNDLFVLNFSGQNLDKINDLFGIEYSGYNIKHGSGYCPKYTSDESYFYIRVKKIKKTWHNNKVWNIQVAQDESYVCEGYAVHNCHYIHKKDAEFHEIVMCISSGRTIKDPKRIQFPYQEFYFKSKEEMAKVFGHVPSMMNNTLEIAEKCDYSDIILGGNMMLPKFDIPEEFSNPYEYLCKLAKDGLKRLGLEGSVSHRERLDLELSDIKLIWDTRRYDFTTYFLIVEDIMRFAKRNGIAAGIRGSGYGSLLLKCLGIVETIIDPVSYELLWERFLGFSEKLFISDDDFGIKN